MPHIGIDISDRSVRYFELLEKRNTLAVGRHGSEKLPEGIVVGGEIVDREKLIELLVRLRKETKASGVRVSIPEEKSYLFTTEIPPLPHDEARGVISFHLEEHVPISVADTVFDFTYLQNNTEKTEAEGKKRVAVAVLPRGIAESYSSVFEEAGLSALSFELKSTATARSLVHHGDGKSYMMVDIGAERTIVSIAVAGEVEFSTTLEIGGDYITTALQKKLSITPEEAEKAKREIGLSKESGNREVVSAILEPVSSLADEINKYFIYWHTREERSNTDRKIQKIILCGGGSNLIGLVDHFMLTLKIPVELGNVWSDIFDTTEEVPPLSFEESMPYATAIGLALRRE
ncbi:MAG: pilus assembly protein PilM [Patescibacteria group bacterium]